MWSAAGPAAEAQSGSVIQYRDGGGDSTSPSTVRPCGGGSPVHLVVVKSPPDDVNSESYNSSLDEYPWRLTYRRLRRASAMM